jgi:hypothetical protein
MLGSSLFLPRNCTCGPRKFDPADILGFCYIVFPTKSVAPLGKSADSTGLKLVIFFSAQHHLSCHRARSRTQFAWRVPRQQQSPRRFHWSMTF